MPLKKIPFEKLLVKSHDLWANQWLVLTSGDFAEGRFNTMTVAWGSLGNMWDRPFAQVVVRPTRYTYEFMEKYESFTLCSFPLKYQKALRLLGSKSGRHGDKIKEAGLTPVPSHVVPAPAFAEAELIFECRKIYWDDLDPAHFLASDIDQNYPRKDYHRVYFGEIVAIRGESQYSRCRYRHS